MYGGENKNDLENESMEHRDVPETTVNWTIPGGRRGQQRQNTQNQNTEGQYPQGQGSQRPSEQHAQGPNTGFSLYGSRVNSQDCYGGDSCQGYQGGGDKHRNHSNKGCLVRRVAEIMAAAVLFGTVSGGVMTGVNYLGNGLTGMYGVTGASTKTQAQNRTGQAAPANVQASGNQGATIVSVVTDVSGIVENAMPFIITINDTMTVEQHGFFGMPQTYTAQSSGSGIIVNQTDMELLIAASNHVVDGAPGSKVTFVSNKDVSAAVKGTNSVSDLATIAMQLKDIPSDTVSKIKVATLSNSSGIKVGQQIIAIGSTLGYGQSVIVGYANTLNREITDERGIDKTFIQIDAAIDPGNSGSALIDSSGKIIGINAARTTSMEMEEMGFIIPISKAQGISNGLITKKAHMAISENVQGYLRIQGADTNAATSQMYGVPIGTYVYKIARGQAASTSDLREEDIIIRFDGQPVTSMEDLRRTLIYCEGGAAITLTAQSLTDGACMEHDVQITLGTRPATQN